MKKILIFLLLSSFSILLDSSIGLFPIPAASQESIQSIKDQCEDILSSICLRGAKVGIKVVSLNNDKTVFEKNAHLPLIPASNMKIITSAAALHLLKPEYTFKTSFYYDGKIKKRVLKGNLYVKGYGAPDLVGEKIWIMLQEFTQSGISRVDGDLIGDDFYFDHIERPPTWPSQINDNPYSAPISALSCNFSSIEVVIKPGPLNGKPYIYLSPFSAYFKVINKAKTKRTKNSISLKRIYINGENKIVVSGTITPQSNGFSDYKSVENPTLYTLFGIHEILRSFNISISGSIRRGETPSTAKEIFTFPSRPLSQIIYDMNKNSNNFMAEMILKTLGAEIIGPPGTTDKGTDVLKLFMKNAVQDNSNMSIFDGSGLSKKNLLSADSIIRVLKFMDRQFGESYDFVASLPIAGVDGTLKNRFTDKSMIREVRGKTGYLKGVSTLSGYIQNKNGDRFAFSILINHSKCHINDTQKIIDVLCKVISQS